MAEDSVSENWEMKGLAWDNPLRVRTPRELINYINEVGFLPLFANKIKGFSVEEHVWPMGWWTDDPEQDPWVWRRILAAGGEVAYGKFFDGKAGFISKEWFPVFANWRRDGYDFDALWDEERATVRSKKIMDLFNDHDRLFSYEAKQLAGFGKGGDKNFQGVVTDLQMKSYLCVCDIRCRKNKAGAEYGWPVSVYTTPERLWGREHIASGYRVEPEESAQWICGKLLCSFRDADEGSIRRFCGL